MWCHRSSKFVISCAIVTWSKVHWFRRLRYSEGNTERLGSGVEVYSWKMSNHVIYIADARISQNGFVVSFFSMSHFFLRNIDSYRNQWARKDLGKLILVWGTQRSYPFERETQEKSCFSCISRLTFRNTKSTALRTRRLVSEKLSERKMEVTARCVEVPLPNCHDVIDFDNVCWGLHSFIGKNELHFLGKLAGRHSLFYQIFLSRCGRYTKKERLKSVALTDTQVLKL